MANAPDAQTTVLRSIQVWERPRRHFRAVVVQEQVLNTGESASFGEGFEQICQALARIADRNDVQLIYPVHPNPNVQDPVRRHLAGHPHVRLIEPQSYVPFVDLMRRAYLLITDSGGIQEEGPSHGKPILVLREKTERPEAVTAGTVKLVGTDQVSHRDGNHRFAGRLGGV